MSPLRRVLPLALAAASAGMPVPARSQSRAALEPERREFAEWLRSAPLSPRRAVVVRPIGTGLTLGPAAADIPLEGVKAGTLEERGGRIGLRSGAENLPLTRGRPTSLGPWRLLVTGPTGRSEVTVFGPELRTGKGPAWYPYDAKAVYSVTLVPPSTPGSIRVLGPDGVEVEASEAGTVSVSGGGGGRAYALRVLRLPGATAEESELEIYFRDGSSGHGSYPAGRFVSLVPSSGNRYVLDLNRARNPFCAYNTVYPCPAPWRGNSLPFPVHAGERYTGGGLETPTY